VAAFVVKTKIIKILILVEAEYINFHVYNGYSCMNQNYKICNFGWKDFSFRNWMIQIYMSETEIETETETETETEIETELEIEMN